jgi:lipopolysaccharide biosynthesis protein
MALIVRATVLIVAYISAIIGSCIVMFVRPVRKGINGLDPNPTSQRYAVYASYDKRNLVADYVVDQVMDLARLGYRVIFVSTSPRLPEGQAEKVARHCWRVLHRRNFGHDFGSYKVGIQQIGPLSAVESLILMNDSCYGPLSNMSDIDQRARASGSNLWGITDSWQSKYHLQSYFLRIDSHALNSRSFRRFWSTMLPYQSRGLAIRNGEVRFTQELVRDEMTTEVLCPYQTVAGRVLQIILARISGEAPGLLPREKEYLGSLADEISKGTPLNQMHSFWDVIIVEFGCPFIKRNLLRENPARIPGMVDWAAFLSQHTKYDTDLINRHLRIG